MAGLPATGKTSLANFLKQNLQRAFVYSKDEYIMRKARELNRSYDETYDEYIRQAAWELNKEYERVSNDRRDIIWDQGNLSSKKREILAQDLRGVWNQVDCYCVLINNPFERKIWLERLFKRSDKTIFNDLLETMENQFEVPVVEEGFDRVFYYDIFGFLTDQNQRQYTTRENNNKGEEN